jgi:CHASE2 domain-containing sensor protein
LRGFDWRRVRTAKLHHWLTAAVLTVVGLILAHYQWMMQARNFVYGVMQRVVSTPPFPNVVVVLIGDEEFYSPRLEHQQPIKRDYVAALIESVSKGNPEVVGVDIEMRSPDSAKADPWDHHDETAAFIKKVAEVSRHCPVVVAKALSFNQKQELWTVDADVSDLIPAGARLTRGYLNLPEDVRQIPLALRTGKQLIPSFPLAVASAKTRKPSLLPIKETDLPYAVFRPREFFDTIPASKVVAANEENLTDWFAHRIVLIGGDWGLRKKGAEERIDAVDTPVGDIPGVYVQATYIESLLHGAMRQMPRWMKIAVELLLAALMSMLFTASQGYWRIGTVIVGTMFVLLLTFFFWQNLGMFFEAFVPTVLLGVHVLGEQILEWRELALTREVVAA